MFTKEDVLRKAEACQVKFIRLQFTDIFGKLKNIAITVEDLPRALEGFEVFDSSAVNGIISKNEMDIRLMPDPSTFVIFPWRPREGAVARLICDVMQNDGRPFAGCSRSVLKKVLAEFEQQSLRVLASIKGEFYMFAVDQSGQPTTVPHDQASYCDLTPLDLGENARREMVLTLEEMGIEIGSSHHELGPGQHEIALKSDEALELADKIMTMRFVVRTIAQRHGLHASFMPKPFKELSGSGMHIKLSLFKELQNVFYNERKPGLPSKELQSFMSGILEHADAITAITNPLVNSYKRFTPNETAPRLKEWSNTNRETMLRIPASSENETWFEIRTPDGCCNPYLALAVLIKSGMAGMLQGKVLKNSFENETEAGGSLLPQTLKDALAALTNDAFLQLSLGEYIFKILNKVKEQEWQNYQQTIHPWEINEYLLRY